ncbi:MAG TPA: hypothetical protein V6C76_07265 [Drouetiella sp.]
MCPKSALACLILLSVIGSLNPMAAQGATAAGDVRIASLETKLFAHPYNNEKLPARVSRLERFVYGNEQTGALEPRMNQLMAQFSTKPELTFDKPQVVAQAVKPAFTVEKPRAATATKSNYPRVTELERELLDEQTFESEPVSARLSRLEGKVFGRSWDQADLAVRTDRLAEYAYLTPRVQELQRAEALRVSMRGAAPIRPVQQARQTTVVDEIESLEKLAFGKISASKPISQRVDALELSMNGATDADKQQNITSRVALLMSKANSFLPNRLGV